LSDAYNLPFLILFPVRDLLVVYIIFFVFRPLKSQEETMTPLVKLNERKVIVKKEPTDQITGKFEFDEVFEPSSSQVNNFRYASH
jgi:hypothetical protein